MSEQYRCNNCGYVFDMSKVMCPECGNGYLEHLRWTKGGDGSHWEGCAEVHWDCKVAQLEAELARRDEERNALADDNRMLSERIQRLVEGVKSRDEIISRLKEDAEDKLQDAQLKPKTVYTVTMYRYGNREWHSYVLGAFSSNDIAREWAAKEEEYRGGKYKAEIIRWGIDSPTDFLKGEL